MTYAFIRHGETDWNRVNRLQGSSDIPLNDAGRVQALEVGMMLAGTRWSAIVSSPLERARESARIIAAELSIELGPAYPELVERDYGPFEGTSGRDALERYPDRAYPGAEPLDSVAARGRAGLASIAADYGDTDVVVVSHGTLIRVTLADIVGHPLDTIHNGSVSTLRLECGEWIVLTVNGLPISPD